MKLSPSENEPRESRHFIQQIIDDDRAKSRVKGDIVTRFPPEPNGYPHIGHAKAICLNFSLAAEYEGRCHLRFDDTNPETEDMEYVRAMKKDIRWLGFEWGEHEYYASDYFEQLYDLAVRLIEDSKAFVDSQTGDEIRATRGSVTEAGTNSPYRKRSIEESLDLFARMRAGEFEDGTHVLRAMIDMASPNMLMRDPVLYRIKKASHYRRGDEWPIYPLYDFAHPLSDAIEGITHSLCTLEFDVHRPLYDWLVDALFDEPRPHQYESARLNLDYTVMSKRKLLKLVEEGRVGGWDDPRMPTLSGMRRRGYTAEALRRFCDLIGVAKADNRVDYAMLEYAVRDDLNVRAPRIMCVLNPLKIVLTNFEEDKTELLEASYWPRDIAKVGTREVPFTREIYIERSDFKENPAGKFFRLSPEQEVRLRYGYIIQCDEVVKDEDGMVVELRCTYDPESHSGGATASRKVKGTVHWVSATKGVEVDVRLYDRLFSVPNPDDVAEGASFMDHLNPDSIEMLKAVIEPSAANEEPECRFQFERLGYFYLDPVDFESGKRIWNRTITLRDTWSKKQEAASKQNEQPRTTNIKHSATQTTQTTESHEVEIAIKDPLAGLDEAAIRLARELAETYGISLDDGAFLAQRDDILAFYREAVGENPKGVANWLIHELRPLLPPEGLSGLLFSPSLFSDLVQLHAKGSLSSSMAREVLLEMISGGRSPDEIVEERGLTQISDTAQLESLAEAVLAAHPDRVEAYRSGKKGLIGFFMGQVMQKTGGAANPQAVKAILEQKLQPNSAP